MGIIYKITNILNGKCYIGQTLQTLEDRWRGHLKKNNNCIYLKNAINIHGKNNFNIEIIDSHHDICMLNELEKMYIIQYNSLVPNGYNLKCGGTNGFHHEETKIKISNALIKIHDCVICKKNIYGGQKKTCSNNCKKELKTINSNKQCRIVIKYDLLNNMIMKYDSCKSASLDNNVTMSAISMVCNYKRKQLGGFVYRYAN